MADLATLKLRREALTSQRASGVARVSYDGKTVDYRSLAEIDRAIEALDRDIALAEGRRIVRQVRVTTVSHMHHLDLSGKNTGTSWQGQLRMRSSSMK